LQTGQYIDGITKIKPEATYKSSRFDFYVEAGPRKIFIEVKGVTLEINGIALFPDAPTQRGVKHLNELAHCIKDGYEAHVVFVVQMGGITHFSPNNDTHPAFGAALSSAEKAGVKVSAMDCAIMPDSMIIRNRLDVKIDRCHF